MRSLAVVFVVLLAGCAGSVTDDATIPETPEPGLPVELPTFETITWHPSLQIASPEGYGLGGEPSIDVAADGTIYLAAPLISYADIISNQQGRIWKSTDDGASFTLLNDDNGRLTSDGSGNGDTDIAVGNGDTVHFVDLGGGIPYSRSDDAGATWSYEGELNEEGRSVDRQWIDARGDFVVATWAAQDGNPRAITFTMSDDAGKTWSEPVDIVDGMIQLGPVALGPHDEIIQPYVTSADYALRVLRSTDRGATWDDIAVGPTFTIPTAQSAAWSPTLIFPVADFDAMGNVALIWSEYKDDGGSMTSYAFSQDGLTWDDAVVLEQGGNNLLPWIVGGAPGRFAAFWYHSDLSMDPNVGPRTWDLWSEAILVAQEETTTVRSTIAELVHVGGICTLGGGCFLGNTPVVNDRTLLDFFEADVTPAGDLIVTWTATSAEGARNPEVHFARQSGGGLLGLA